MLAAEARSGTVLGPLETCVLEAVLRHDQAITVRQIQRSFPDLAYTTLQTTLDRLYRKRVLVRSFRGRAFAYEARCPPEEAFREHLSSQVRELLKESGATTAVLSALVSAVSREDALLLSELDSLVRAECARLKGRK